MTPSDVAVGIFVRLLAVAFFVALVLGIAVGLVFLWKMLLFMVSV